jgi:D-alanyl-D-alanine carboxypeptidase (penicillin-binding protein 5/6)
VAVPAGSAGKLKTQIARPDPLLAPLTKGQQVGSFKVSLADQPYVEQPLFVLQDVEQAGWIGRTWDAVRLWIQ